MVPTGLILDCRLYIRTENLVDWYSTRPPVMDVPWLPEPKHCFTTDDGSVKVPALLVDDDESNARQFKEVQKSLAGHKWVDGDVMLTTHCKNGTHFLWEVMSMLVLGSVEYLGKSKNVCQVDFCPIRLIDEVFPSPRVLNTHLRLDVLPPEFRRQKTVWGLRNPKDTATSYYHQLVQMGPLAPQSELFQVLSKMTFPEFLQVFLFSNDITFGNYFAYVEYMWSLRDEPNILVVFYEDLKSNPLDAIEKIDEFLGTDRSAEVVQEIADATHFSKMKVGKVGSSKAGGVIDKYGVKSDREDNPLDSIIYRKGEVGDWKNKFTVADDELFNSFLDKWTVGKEIPFRYN